MLTLRWWSTPPSCSSPSPTCSWALEVLRGSRPQRYLSHFNSQLSWGRRLRMEPIVQSWGQKTAWIWSLPSSTTTQEWLPNFTWMKTSKRQSYTFWWGRRPKPELPCRRTWIGTSGRNVRSPASCWGRHGGCCQLTPKNVKSHFKKLLTVTADVQEAFIENHIATFNLKTKRVKASVRCKHRPTVGEWDRMVDYACVMFHAAEEAAKFWSEDDSKKLEVVQSVHSAFMARRWIQQ